jgi:WD40 repeat protein
MMEQLRSPAQDRSPGTSPADEGGPLFDAFISYRHLEPDRRWARWVQRQLETYRIPASVPAKKHPLRRLRPIFRDEDELAAASHLPDELKANLRRSEFLIVICSPNTPKSEWIDQEIRYFAELGRADRILALLVDGEPDVAFPPALLQLALPGSEEPGTEPLAADVRQLPGESRRERQRLAKLKLVARIVGCRFDELRKREQMRRIRRLTILAAGLAVLAVGLFMGIVTVIGTATVALRDGARAERSAAESRRRLVTGLLESGVRAQEGGDLDRALVYFAEAISSDAESADQPSRTWVDRWLDRWRRQPPALPDDSQQEMLRLRYAAVLRAFPRLVRVIPPDTGAVASALSPDGRCLLTGSDSVAPALWNVETGQRCVGLDARVLPASVRQFQFDHAGERFLTQDTLGKLQVWSTRTGQLVSAVLPDVREAVDLSPDGNSVLIAPNNADVAEAIDVRTGSTRRTYGMVGDTTTVTIAAYSPDGRFVATAGWSGNSTIGELWDAATGRRIGVPMLHQDYLRDQTRAPIDFATVSHMAFDRTGTRLVTASWGGAARVWNARTGLPITPALRHTLWQGGKHVDHYVLHAAFAPSGRHVVSAGVDGTARVWDARTGAHVCSTPRETEGKPVFYAEFSPDGERFATAAESGVARVWSTSACDPETPPLRHAGPARTARFTRDGRRLVTTGSGTAVRVWDVASEPSARVPEGGGVMARFTTAGARIVVHGPGVLDVWDPVTRGRVPLALDPGTTVTHAVLSADGNRLAALDAAGNVGIWNTATGRRLARVLRASTAGTDAGGPLLRISRDGSRVLTSSSRAPALWDATGGELIVRLPKDASVEFGSEGQYFFVRSGDSLSVRDAASGGPLALRQARASASVMLDGFAYAPRSGWSAENAYEGVVVHDWIGGDTIARFIVPVNGAAFHQRDFLAFSPGGERLVTAVASGEIRLWDPATGRPTTLPLGLGAQVRTIQFSQDGRLLLTLTDDGRPRVWDVRAWLPAAPPLSRGAPVQDAAFDPSGHRVVTLAVRDGLWTARVWDISPESRSARDLQAVARFLTGLRIDESGGTSPRAA